MPEITLAVGPVSVDLNPDLYWPDEFTWNTVEKSTTRSLTGARIVQTGTKLGGRPITLQPEDDRSGAVPRSVLEQLHAWAYTAGLQLTLTLRGIARTVEIDAIEARPFIHYSDTDPGDFYLVTLRMTEV